MQEFLQREWGVNATVLYDKPPVYFHECSLEEAHHVFYSIQKDLRLKENSLKAQDSPNMQDYQISKGFQLKEHTLVTLSVENVSRSSFVSWHDPAWRFLFAFLTILQSHGKVEYLKRIDKPVVIVSSTSWTPDEDFSILLDAIHKVDEIVASKKMNHFPEILLLITGGYFDGSLLHLFLTLRQLNRQRTIERVL
jgi:beta-1,4-mannosyltransferase